MTSKPWHSPDIKQSIDSGVPKAWLSPDIAQAVTARHRKQWTPPDIGEDIDAADTNGGGGGGEFTLQLGGLNLQLDGQDLTLGA